MQGETRWVQSADTLTGKGGVHDPEEEAERGEGTVGGLLRAVFRRRRAAGEHREEHQHRLRHNHYNSQEEAHGERGSVLAHNQGAADGQRDEQQDLAQRGRGCRVTGRDNAGRNVVILLGEQLRMVV